MIVPQVLMYKILSRETCEPETFSPIDFFVIQLA